MTNLLLYNLLNSISKRNLQFVRKSSSVQIPKRVKRDNLTILKELASTVKTDYGGTHYQFINDPFLVPISGIDKKVAALSVQSGRNAARYVMNEYPNLFRHDTSFPVVKDFSPPPQRSPKDDVLEEVSDLVGLMKPLEAYAAYKRVLDAGVTIPRPLLDDLLDLLCFTNAEPLTKPLPAETRFYMDVLESAAPNEDEEDGGRREAPEWRVEGPAESIFKALSDASSRNISSIIKGRCKFKAYDLALEEYMKIMETKTKVDETAHNAILTIIPHVKQQHAEAWEFILDVLRLMQETHVRPSVDTFDSALSALRDVPTQGSEHIPIEQVRMKFSQALMLVAELVSCKMTPSLTTWWHLLEISYPNFKTRGLIINDIIEYVASNNTTLHRASDFEFFDSAMTKCLKNARSLQSAKKLHNLVVERSWEFMLGPSNKTSGYFTSYICTLLQHDNISNVMQEYNKLVPNFYFPTFKVMNFLLKAVEQHYAYEYLPKIWKDMLAFRYNRRRDLLSQLLSVVSRAPFDQKLQGEYVAVADDIFNLYLQDASMPHLNKPLELLGNQVSDILTIYINVQLYEKAWNVFSKFLEISMTGSGLISEEPLVSLCHHYMKENDYAKTLAILKVMWEYGLTSAEVLVEEACMDMRITDAQKIQLKNLLVE